MTSRERVRISVRVAKTKRDGILVKWMDRDGTPRQKSTMPDGTPIKQSKRGEAAAVEAWELHLNPKKSKKSKRGAMLWFDYWRKFRDEHLYDLSPKHVAKCKTMQKRLVDASGRGQDLRCRHITMELIRKVETSMRSTGVEESTVKSNMDTLWSILTFGQELERPLINPALTRPKKRRGKKAKQLQQKKRKSKGRALHPKEVAAMEAAIVECCKDCEKTDGFLRAMSAMRLIGMRLQDAWLFHWIPTEGTHYPVDLNSDKPAIHFSSVQKSGEDQLIPLTPAAAKWLRTIEATRPPNASPWVCRTVGLRGEHRTNSRLGRVIADAGKRANIVVKRFSDTKIKYASAHDLRRTFAQEMYAYLRDRDNVSGLTRHADPQTLEYYLDSDVSTPELFSKVKAIFSSRE